ncbi:MAG: MBL fold metallo-hydrolase [Candidatus Neomarinimicrobiota bacterium]
MKKTPKRLIQVLGIIILLIIILSLGYALKAKSEMKKMTPAETGDLTEDIFSIKDTFVNLFLIKDGDEYIAIDCGNDISVVSDELNKHNVDPDDVSTVLLTHSDFDHVAALKLFKNAKIFFSKNEEQMINGETARFPFFHNKISRMDYTLLVDQQIFQIGNLTVKGILTRGHTPGSMCYLINDKYLFTGDALSIKNGKIDKFNKFFNMDTETATESIGRITELIGVEYIFSAHYGYSDDYQNAVKDWKN